MPPPPPSSGVVVYAVSGRHCLRGPPRSPCSAVCAGRRGLQEPPSSRAATVSRRRRRSCFSCDAVRTHTQHSRVSGIKGLSTLRHFLRVRLTHLRRRRRPAAMRVAPRVLFLVRDAAGYGAALADALRPRPELTRESSPFELPLGKYGLDGEKASGELLNFSDSNSSPQVSIFVLPDYKPPLAACVVNEVLELISSEATSTERVLIVPFITRSSSYRRGMEHATKAAPVLHGAEIGATTDYTHLFVGGTTKPPTSLQIRSEPILCLLEMVRVLKMPTVLVTSGGQQQGKSSTVSDLEVLQCLGEHLAKHMALEFSKETVLKTGIEKSPIDQEPWRELYG